MSEADRRRHRSSYSSAGRLGAWARVASAAIVVVVVLAMAAVVMLVARVGADDDAGTRSGTLDGSFTSPYLEGRPVARAEGSARGSTLTIGSSTYKLTSGIWGLLGDFRADAQTVEFHSATGYFKLPLLTAAASTPPDADNRCPGSRGLYRWKRDGRTLRFRALHDDCTGRKHQLEGANWTAGKPSQL
jgi:hypothetical protein